MCIPTSEKGVTSGAVVVKRRSHTENFGTIDEYSRECMALLAEQHTTSDDVLSQAGRDREVLIQIDKRRQIEYARRKFKRQTGRGVME
jgi:cell division septum initiation protein DivIVA